MTYVLAQVSAPSYDFMHLTPKAGALANLNRSPEIAALLPDVYCPMPFRTNHIMNIEKKYFTQNAQILQ
jgi:hypothetical protein